MSGEQTRTPELAQTPPGAAGAASQAQHRAGDDRTGRYGGDDGALEHERAEPTAADTRTTQATEGSAQAQRKPGR